MSENIVEDFKKIRDHLELPEDLALEVEFTHNEGFYYSSKPSVMIGILHGYNRRLLIHECLHAKGMIHYEIPTYGSTTKTDEFSAQIEEKIFGVVPKG